MKELKNYFLTLAVGLMIIVFGYGVFMRWCKYSYPRTYKSVHGPARK